MLSYIQLFSEQEKVRTAVHTWEANSSETAKMMIQTDRPTWPEPPHSIYTACRLLPAVTEYVMPEHVQTMLQGTACKMPQSNARKALHSPKPTITIN